MQAEFPCLTSYLNSTYQERPRAEGLLREWEFLLYDVLLAAHLCVGPCVVVQFAHASAEAHPSILGGSHQNDLTWLTASTERLPVAVFSEQI